MKRDASAANDAASDMFPPIDRRGLQLTRRVRRGLWAALCDRFAAAPVPLVFDHFADAQAALGVDQSGFGDLLELVESGKAYVKISGAYRASKAAPNYADVIPLAKALIAANPDRIVWGTDWPHPNSVTPPDRKVT